MKESPWEIRDSPLPTDVCEMKMFQRGKARGRDGRDRARKQPKCNLEMEGKCLGCLCICALGWGDNGVGWFLHCKCIRVQSPCRGVLHQDQDLNNVALSLSCRHTLRQTCWNWLAVCYSQKPESQTAPTHSSATSLLLAIHCLDSRIRSSYIPWFKWGLHHNLLCIVLWASSFSSKAFVKLTFW